MAEKRPVCLYNGQLQELNSGDTLPGAAGGSAAVYDKNLAQPGDLVVVAGTSRWYPPVNCTLVDALAYVGSAPTGGSVIIGIKKNGTAIAALEIIAGAFKSAVVVPSDLVLLTTDYLTIDVTQVPTVTGSDLNVQIQYTKD